MNTSDLSEYLAFGDSLIAKTRALILELWSRDSFASRLKEDQTPVSEVDLRCEELVRKIIADTFPEHGVIGEEHGADRETAEFVWTIDPIDGTQNLINRIPTFGTILALLHRGVPVLGWIDHPVLNVLTRGGSEVGVFQNGKRLVLPDISEGELTANDVIATNCPATFERGGHRAVLDTVLNWHPHVRMYYDVYSHTLAIQGALAIMIEYNLKIWDLAATKALIEGAGGTYREIGQESSASSFTRYHAAFGKKGAVALSETILS
jgi:fructose-1,6-bisphosphatase/inositol monophosphatase family enzyme